MKAVIVYLTQAGKMLNLSRSLTQLKEYLLDKFPYPVQMFHEGDFTQSHMQLLWDIYRDITFRQVNIDPPPHIDLSQKHEWAMIQRFGIGYRNMCRFFSLGLYPFIDTFDYYMRLDDDSFILSPFPEDPFKTMEENKCVYGFRCMRPETGAATAGLIDCVRQAAPGIKLNWRKRVFYNNFHIAKPSLWLREPIATVLKAIDQHGGIYTGRWGDAPIQTMLVQGYVLPSCRHQFTGFGYKHGRHKWPAA